MATASSRSRIAIRPSVSAKSARRAAGAVVGRHGLVLPGAERCDDRHHEGAGRLDSAFGRAVRPTRGKTLVVMQVSGGS